MIEENLTRQFLSVIDAYCDEQLKQLDPNVGGQETYDHGICTGIKIMIERMLTAIDNNELDPRENYRKKIGSVQEVNGKDRKVFIMEGDEEQHATS